MSSQPGWRWCHFCQGLFFSGHRSQGVCAGNGGGPHDSNNIGWNFSVLQGDGIAGAQPGWRYCWKCQGFFVSNPGSVCPASGTHDPSQSGHYSLQVGDSVPGTQGLWRWCRKCQGLFYSGNVQQGECPATKAAHDPSASEAYGVPWQNPTSFFDTGTGSANIRIDGDPADANVAVSATHVCVTARGAFACYTRAGTLVGLGPDFAAQPYLAKDFFEASGISTLTLAAPGDTDFTKDGRVVFDVYSARFFMVFQTREPIARLLIGVSKSQDPSDGWWTYADVVGSPGEEGHDYHRMGVNYSNLLVSDCMQNVIMAGQGFPTRTRHLMYSTADLVAGNKYTRGEWSDPNADNACPCVHASYATTAFWVHRDDDSHASVWAVREGKVTTVQFAIQSSSAAIDGIQPGGGAVDFGQHTIGSNPQSAQYRDGKIVFVSNDGFTWPGQPGPNSAVRVVRIDVTKFFDATPSVTVEIDRIFGLSNQDDPPGSVFDYGMPAVATNANGDIVVGSVRSNSTTFPQLRASVWYKNQPDISPSVLIAASTAQLVSYHMAGACSDPTSDGVYLGQQWADSTPNQSWRIRVAEMLNYPH